MEFNEVKDLLEEKSITYNRPEFIESDPVSIPHLFSGKEDIEISGFLTAIISWGQRKTIIQNAVKLLRLMDFEPFDFISNARDHDFKVVSDFQHRTFNGTDCQYFLKSLQNIYLNHGGLESAFDITGEKSVFDRIIGFRDIFFELPVPDRVKKHIANPAKGSSAKRINMFLRWMVRKDEKGVDFGIWKSISPADLYCPLDIHSGNVARKLGLITRKQTDWKTLEELMTHLRSFDPRDPVKYDYALFGLGIFEDF